ncbi:MAG TPA: hypothetical protein VFX15_04675 [Actinomycetes bacterium]|nr:hypothetical protein [Actinomycetes bacterium]
MSENPETGPVVRPPHAPDEADRVEQSELDLGVVSTGSPEVDRALTPIEELADRSVSDHPEIFERVLDGLTATMTEGAEANDSPANEGSVSEGSTPDS